jgi:hypothetical protein
MGGSQTVNLVDYTLECFPHYGNLKKHKVAYQWEATLRKPPKFPWHVEAQTAHHLPLYHKGFLQSQALIALCILSSGAGMT